MKALPFVAVVLLALVPIWVQSPYALHIFILLFTAVALGEGWNVIGGLAGQYSVGHAAFSGVGAYATLILLQYRHIAPWYGVFCSLIVSIVIALIIGSITFRLRGPYFVLASIAVAEIVRLIALNWKDLTNGAEGILASDLPPLKFGSHLITDWNGKNPYYFLGLAMAAFSVWVTWLVKRRKLGFYLQPYAKTRTPRTRWEFLPPSTRTRASPSAPRSPRWPARTSRSTSASSSPTESSASTTPSSRS
jgi:branched-chain amino acid transport system permease protein